jgi:hypothetical protein
MNMSEAFETTRNATRLFQATHLASGQKFELRGKQGVHYWEARKIEKGVVSKYVFLDDWQSKKRLLENLDKKIMQELQKDAQLAEYKKQQTRAAKESLERMRGNRGSERFRPQIYAKLQRKTVNRAQTTLFAPESNEKFTLFDNGKDGYRIEPFAGGQPICTGMTSEDSAILELYYYLDVDVTPENYQEYRDQCFRKRSS